MQNTEPELDKMLAQLPDQLNAPWISTEFKIALLGAALAEALREVRSLRTAAPTEKERE